MSKTSAQDTRPILPGVSKTTDTEALKALRRFHVDPEAEPGGRYGGVPEGVRPAWFFAQREQIEAATPISGSPLEMLMTAVRERLPAARQTFAAEARSLATALDGLLESDQRGSSGGAGGDLGDLGGRFVDPSALAGVVGERRGSAALPKSRRQRLQASRDALAAFAQDTPGPILVHRDSEPIPELRTEGSSGSESSRELGLRVDKAFDPCAAAVELFDREAEELARTLAAARRARLAVAQEYDPGRHDLWLDRLSWRELSADELHLLPPVLVWVSADWLARGGMTGLSKLLLSGRWVQVLVEVDPAEQPGAAEPGTDPLTAFRFEAGYLGMGHREVFVQQGSTARPERLAEGFRRALAGARPGLHVVARAKDGESKDGESTEAAQEAALEARAHPVFRYDPEAGASWARRLDFAGNPAPEDDWPAAELPCRTAAGADEVLSLVFTFADYALLAPALAGHFRLVPDGVPEAELTPLAAAVTRPVDEAPVLPFVWAVDEDGGECHLLRLAVSRPLLAACRDRLDLWRSLQELAGVRSEYVDEAVERLQGELEARFAGERQELEARHAEDLERVRRTAAEEAANRMTAALLDLDLATVAGLGGGAPGAGSGDGAAGLSFAGQTPDQVAARLLEMVRPETLELDAEEDPEPSAEGSSAVQEMTQELMKLVETET